MAEPIMEGETDGYRYQYNADENNGSFTRIDNPQCHLDFQIDSEEPVRRFRIDQFHCFTVDLPQGVGVVTRSGGQGRAMLREFLNFFRPMFQDIETVIMEVDGYPDQRLPIIQQRTYYSNDEEYQPRLARYFEGLGFQSLNDGSNYYKANIIELMNNIDAYQNENQINNSGGRTRRTGRTRTRRTRRRRTRRTRRTRRIGRIGRNKRR